jgi:hypothetical protein
VQLLANGKGATALAGRAGQAEGGCDQVVGPGLGGGFLADGVGKELTGVQAYALGLAVAACV